MEGVVPTLVVEEGEKEVEEDEGVENVNDNNDVFGNEGSETLGNPESTEKEKVRDDTKNSKRESPKNVNSAMTMKAPQVKIDPPFTQTLKKKEEGTKIQKFLSIFNFVSIIVPLVEAITKMPGYAKFMKALVTKEKT